MSDHVRRKRTTTVHWDTRIDERLDGLRDLATSAGERVSRAEILAALVFHAPLDGEGLGVLVRNYRRAPAEELTSPRADVDCPRLGRPRAS